MHSEHLSVTWTCTHSPKHSKLCICHMNMHSKYICLLNMHNYPCTVNICHLKLFNTDSDRRREQKHWSKLLNTDCDQRKGQKYWSKVLNTDWSEERIKALIQAVEHCDQRRGQKYWSKLLNTVIRGENRSPDQSCWTLTVIRGENRSTDQILFNSFDHCFFIWSQSVFNSFDQ